MSRSKIPQGTAPASDEQFETVVSIRFFRSLSFFANSSRLTFLHGVALLLSNFFLADLGSSNVTRLNNSRVCGVSQSF